MAYRSDSGGGAESLQHVERQGGREVEGGGELEKEALVLPEHFFFRGVQNTGFFLTKPGLYFTHNSDGLHSHTYKDTLEK